MRKSTVSEINFEQVCKLLRVNASPEIIDTVDELLGWAALISPVATGSIAGYSAIGPKNEFIRLVKKAYSRLNAEPDDTFAGRNTRAAAAHCLCCYSAFFSAAKYAIEPLGTEATLPSFAKSLIASEALRKKDEDEPAAALEMRANASVSHPRYTQTPIRLPHPAEAFDDHKKYLHGLYTSMTSVLTQHLRGLAVYENARERERSATDQHLSKLAGKALESYADQYLALAADYPDFLIWAQLRQADSIVAQLNDASRRVQVQIELATQAKASIDVGFKVLENAIDRIPEIITRQQTDRAMVGLQAAYSDSINAPIVIDEASNNSPESLTYPRKCDIFIPQAFRCFPHVVDSSRLEDAATWASHPIRDDIGSFLIDYLSSPYSIEAPLILLGHPGSGKSFLTEIVCARLASADYSPVRVELRDIDAEGEFQTQIEDQVWRQTGRTISWPTFAESRADAPPLIVLDGFDELLQASGRVYANYLTRVRAFQQREAVQGRPVRVIVTSRITLIDKARMPHGSTILRLEDFDDHRKTLWADIWNTHNAEYFHRFGIQPFELPRAPSQVEILSRQPLLLLMLAVFDSDENQLRQSRDLSQSMLYDTLLRRFIRRERLKGKAGEHFKNDLTGDQQAEEIDSDMQRLAIAAMSMFNRQTLHILRDQLNADISYFKLERDHPEGSGTRLTQADLLLGGFFFVHESRSKSQEDGHDSSVVAFEFLHNTFGEFLTADFMVRQVAREVDTLHALKSNPSLSNLLDVKLSRPDSLLDQWYVAFMYTSLHTRPVVLRLLKEWANQTISKSQVGPENFLTCANELISHQLKHVLEGRDMPGVMRGERQPPYQPKSLLAHLAIYSLNLILLRASLQAAMPDNRALEPLAESTWEPLTHLWRSALPIETFDALASIANTVRSDIGEVIIQIREAQADLGLSSPLTAVIARSRVLSDTVPLTLAELHAQWAGLAADDLSHLRSMAARDSLDDDLDAQRLVLGVQGHGWLQIVRDGDLRDRFIRHSQEAMALTAVSPAYYRLLELIEDPDIPLRLLESLRRGFRDPTFGQLGALEPNYRIRCVSACARVEPQWARWFVDRLVERWQSGDTSDNPDARSYLDCLKTLTGLTSELDSWIYGAVGRLNPNAVEYAMRGNDLPTLIALALLAAESEPALRDQICYTLERELELLPEGRLDPSLIPYLIRLAGGREFEFVKDRLLREFAGDSELLSMTNAFGLFALGGGSRASSIALKDSLMRPRTVEERVALLRLLLSVDLEDLESLLESPFTTSDEPFAHSDRAAASLLKDMYPGYGLISGPGKIRRWTALSVRECGLLLELFHKMGAREHYADVEALLGRRSASDTRRWRRR